MRGSRRNQRSWRRANRRVRGWPARRPRRASSSPVEVVEQLLVAERLRRRAGEPRGSASQRRAPRRGSPPRSGRRSAPRCGRRRSSAVAPQADERERRSAGRRRGRARSCENGRPLPRVTSSARTTRRRLRRLHPGGGGRVELAAAGVQRRRVGVGLELGPDLGVLPGDVEVVDDRPQVERRCRRRAGPGGRGPRCRRWPRARSRWNPATVKSSHGSTRSSRWWGTSACSAGGGLGRADVHAPVHLHRVDRHQLPARGRGGRAPAPAPTCPTRSRRRATAWRPGSVTATGEVLGEADRRSASAR